MWRGVIAAIMLCCGAAMAQSATLSATLTPPETPFHRPATLTITVEAPADAEVGMPELSADAYEALEVTPGELERETLDDGRQRLRQSIVLDPLEPRTHVIPPLAVQVGGETTLRTPALVLRARELTEAEQETVMAFADIATVRDIIGEQRPTPWGWIGLLGGALAVLLGVAAWLLWRASRPEVAPAPLPPWEVAHRRLRELGQRRLPQQGKYERFYVDLSSILRFYIEDQFHIHAPEQTTPEFLETAAKHGAFSETHQQLLEAFLKHADRVKFARHVPTQEEMDQNFKAVEQFVKDTEPKPEPEPLQVEETAA